MKPANMMTDMAFASSRERAPKVSLRASERKLAPAAGVNRSHDSFDRALDEARQGRKEDRRTVTSRKEEPVAAKEPVTAKAETGAAPKEMAPRDTAGAKEAPQADEKSSAVAEAVAPAREAATVQETEPVAEVEPVAEGTAENSPALKEEAAILPEMAATPLNAMLMAMASNALPQQGQGAADGTTATAVVTAAPAGGQPNPVSNMPLTLEALLPQDAATATQAAQNQQLMDMLAKAASQAATTAVLAEEAPAPAVLLQEKVQALMAADQEALQPIGTAEILQTAVSDVDEMRPAAENIAPRLAVTVLPDKTETVNQPADDMWQGVKVTVENGAVLTEKADTAAFEDMTRRQPQGEMDGLAAALQASAETAEEGMPLSEPVPFEAVPAAKEDARETAPPSLGIASALAPEVSQAAPANTAGPTEAAAPKDYQVVRQIVEQAKLIRIANEGSEMVIRLKPEHLGELTLRVSVTADGKVNAAFHTENLQTRGIIESSMIQLKQELQAQGIKVDNVSVFSGLSQDFFANSQAGQQGYPQPSAQSRKLDMAALEDDAEGAAAGGVNRAGTVSSLDPNVGTEDGVDYRV